VEPELTDRDIQMLLLSDDDLVTLGAMLGLRLEGAKASPLRSSVAEPPGC